MQWDETRGDVREHVRSLNLCMPLASQVFPLLMTLKKKYWKQTTLRLNHD